MVFVQLLSDELQDFGHKLLLVEIKSFQEQDDQLDKAVDELIVHKGVVRAQFTLWALLGQIDTCVDADAAELKHVQHVFFDLERDAEVLEKVIHRKLLTCSVCDVAHFDPLQEESAELALQLGQSLLLKL